MGIKQSRNVASGGPLLGVSWEGGTPGRGQGESRSRGGGKGARDEVVLMLAGPSDPIERGRNELQE